MLYKNLGVNTSGHLTFCGLDTVELARKHGTPLYLTDENGIRERCRIYKTSMEKYFGEGSLPIYAGKALCFKKIYEIIADEGLGADVSSTGELYTAVKAGFPADKLFFHGNNKTESDIRFAVDQNTGCFMCDNEWELASINTAAGDKGIKQKVILRLTPGIDTHTFEAVNTGKVDSKFGVAIETGQAETFVKHAIDMENIDLIGYHCHIGSQIFEGRHFVAAGEIMLKFAAYIRDKYGYYPEYLDLGGGFGVPYVATDPVIDYEKEIENVAVNLKKVCVELNVKLPKIIMEPGRSIVADKAITLYTVGGIKEIPGFKNYVAIDGGMSDNPRYALYRSAYTVVLASRAEAEADYDCTVAGRCCESGDLIQENVKMPKPVRDEILAVLTTGAYNYSMASNYNRMQRPPVVMVKDGVDYVAVRRESLDDLLANDM